jgi:hypothetical protein
VSVVSEEDSMATRTVFRVPGADQSDGGFEQEAAWTREDTLAAAAVLGGLLDEDASFWVGTGNFLARELTPGEKAVILVALRGMVMEYVEQGGH